MTTVLRSAGGAVESFEYSANRWAFDVKAGGVCVQLRLSLDEMRDFPADEHDPYVVESLTDYYIGESLAGPRPTMACWDRPEGEDPPPLLVYRDDWFCVLLPHEVGRQLLAVVRDVLEPLEEALAAKAAR
jgi:hypothetical protein